MTTDRGNELLVGYTAGKQGCDAMDLPSRHAVIAPHLIRDRSQV